MANRHAVHPLPRASSQPLQQPSLLVGCTLKEYQLKGMAWLVSLYEQGINGILADEMGLGKTVQSIALLTYLAEQYGLWGPYLVITPASTLHNWLKEIETFVPKFKVIPYWGDPSERQVLRQCWSSKKGNVFHSESAVHIVVTSYQYALRDLKYFCGLEWEYMVLDEAQAIKSSQSMRWNALLQIKSRNRLLLTGTPVQNNMKELWALLHFIMPTLFDSHAEFNAWFSKDIESAAIHRKHMNKAQVKRLHLILQPFMLRRLKRDVQRELGEKIEIKVPCKLTHSQFYMYHGLQKKIAMTEILESIKKASLTSRTTSHASSRHPSHRHRQLIQQEQQQQQHQQHLMNLVMQLRKVCNHPALFERSEAQSPYVFGEMHVDIKYPWMCSVRSAFLHQNPSPTCVLHLLVPLKSSMVPFSNHRHQGHLPSLFQLAFKDVLPPHHVDQLPYYSPWQWLFYWWCTYRPPSWWQRFLLAPQWLYKEKDEGSFLGWHCRQPWIQLFSEIQIALMKPYPLSLLQLYLPACRS
ncbi:putative DNA helicase ino80 [Coelomomyces lativittatus]|nr:putative DNA helicase ino80 [Coelomomyces lativittatus]